MAGKIGQYLRDNDWLMNIKSRAAIPGGVCEFDLPSYHWWLHRDPGIRREAISGWTRPLLPLRDAAAIVLRLLRSSGRPKEHTAVSGQFQPISAARRRRWCASRSVSRSPRCRK